jgi:cysteine-rich repeat protein
MSRLSCWIVCWMVAVLVALGCGRTELEVGPLERPSTCGNHLIEADEQCDDGDDDDRNACTTSCRFARCGDGIVFRDVEGCDDGNDSDTDGCTRLCALPSCGNGIVDSGEACDDGNADDGDACTRTCQAARCGDGHVWRQVEACDLGPANENRPALEVLQGPLAEPLVPIDGGGPPAGFYAYQSASAHTGFEALMQSRLYFYRERPSARLSLFVHHGIDIDSTGIEQPRSRVNMSITYLPPGIGLDLTDDKPEELWIESATAHAAWEFHQNTDGGVLGGFPFPGNWAVEVTMAFVQGVNSWNAFDAAGAFHTLQLAQLAILRANDARSTCRLDCTVPRCGDGILDGGEVCDDNNQLSGDGCSADCTSLD